MDKMRRHWLASTLAVGAFFVPSARAATFQWTGNAPIFVAEWFNGTTTEFHEFQGLLEWQTFCNSRAGAACETFSLWSSPGNWDRNALPGLGDTVVIGASTVVTMGSFNSIYQGSLLPFGQAGLLTMGASSVLKLGLGTLRIATAGAIDTLALGLAGTLLNDGTVTVSNLAFASGQIRGTGTTKVNGSTAAKLDTGVQSGHTMEWAGSYSGTIDITLSSLATFHNTGNLQSVSGVGKFNLLGGTSLLDPGIVRNTGVMEGSFLFSNTRLLNDGSIDIGAGSLVANNNGIHAGSFIGAAGSEMRFAATGAGNGHRFLPGSSMSTQGRVVFSGTNHIVEGTYAAQETIVGTNFATLRFLSRPSSLPVVIVNPSSQVTFASQLGVDIGELTIGAAGANAFAFFSTGTASTAGKVSLLAGGLNTQAALNITGELVWNSGTLIGPVTAGSVTLGAGVRTLTGTLRNLGSGTWMAGSFLDWTGKLINSAGATFDLKSDVTVSGTGGSIENAGLFLKSDGTGTTTFTIAFDNSGRLEVQKGTLKLAGGGQHSGALVAGPGARIDLSGDNQFTNNVSPTGNVNFLGGRIQIINGTFTNNAQIAGVDLRVDPAGRLLNRGAFNSNLNSFVGQVDNFGEIVNESSIAQGAVLWNLNNKGFIHNTVNAHMVVAASWTHSDRILNDGSFEAFAPGTVSGRITNFGTMRLGNQTLTSLGVIENWGSLELQNMLVEGKVQSTSTNDLNGISVHIAPGGSLTTAGMYLGSGFTWIDGLLEATGGFLQNNDILKGVGVLRGDVALGGYAQVTPGSPTGTLTIQGNLDITTRAFGPFGNIVIEIAGANDHGKLLVSGHTALDAVADLSFAPGYLPKDGQAFTWLRSNTVSGFVEARLLGLPFDWQATTEVGPTAVTTTLLNEPAADFSAQIQTFGVVSIAQGNVGQNFVSLFSPVVLDGLNNAGWFVNQTDAGIEVRDLQNRAGAKIANRGDMRITGLFDNSGTIYNRAGGVFYNFAGGSNTGTITNAGSLYIVDLPFTNAKGGYLESRGELGVFGFNGGQFINDGEVQLYGSAFNSYSTAFFQGTIQNRGTFVVNSGATVEGTGSYYQVYGNDFAEPTTVVNGVLGSADVRFYAGSVSGTGTIVSDTVYAFGMRIEPGGTVGTVMVQPSSGASNMALRSMLVAPASLQNTLTIDGNFIADGVTFNIEFAGDGSRDVLHVTGQTTLVGTNFVRFLFVDGYAPQAGDSFVWLASDGGVSGLAQLVHAVFVRSSGGELSPWEAPADLSVSFRDGRLEVTAVPEPEQWAQFFAGLIVLGWAAYRRSSALRRKRCTRLPNVTIGDGAANV